jgi:predicted permease
VASATAAALTPIGGMRWNSFVMTEGYQPASERENLVWFNGVADGYFSTLGIDLLAGRDFNSGDRKDGPQVAIITQSVARRLFGNTSPIGRQMWVQNGDKPDPPMEIVGLVADAKYASLRDTVAPTVYRPWPQTDGFGYLTFAVRSREEVALALPGILETAKGVLPNSTLNISTLSSQLSQSLSKERLMATLSGFFGGLALLLALIGLYGTMAYNVARRKKEIGIRVALGATRSRLIGMVTGEAGRMIVAGLVLGGIGTFGATRLVESFLYGRTPLDPLTMILAAFAVGGIALLAGALPALRAVRQDPQAVLREE